MVLALYAGNERPQQGCPWDESDVRPTGFSATYSFKRCTVAAPVLKPLKAIVGELIWWRGNKVFQVVTPAGQGFPTIFAGGELGAG
jgi:hypothetical protein